MGARPLARIIDDEIKKPLSRMILFGDLQEGGRVEVTVKEDKLVIDYNKAQVQVLDQFKPRVADEKKTQ